MGLVQGSSVRISRQTPNTLLISAPTRRNERKSHNVASLVISRPESPETTVRKIDCLYSLGYNLIKIRFADGNPINSMNANAVRDIVRSRFIGVEVLADSSDYLLLQVLLGKSNLSTESAIKQMSMVSRELQRDAISALVSLDKKMARQLIEERAVECQRFASYVNRMVLGMMDNEVNLSEKTEEAFGATLPVYLLMAKSIGSVSNLAKTIAQQTMELDRHLERRICDGLVRVSQFSYQLFDSAMLSYLKVDAKAAESTIESTKQLTTMVRELQISQELGNVVTPAQHDAISTVLTLLERIAEECVAICELVIGLTIRKVLQVENLAAPAELLQEKSTIVA